MRKIAIANQKGGVGKTLTVLNLSCGLALRDKKALMIDLDSQAALTGILLKDPVEKSLFDLLSGQGKPGDYIREIRENLFLLPGDSRLIRLESTQMKDRELILKAAMADVRGFDFIILDCAPSLGLFTMAALVFADSVMIPVKTDYLSLQGLIKINDLIEIVKERMNPGLEILGYLPTQFDRRRVLDREVLAILKKRFKRVFNPVRQNISLGESVSWGESIFEYKRDSTGARDYDKLARNILKESGS